MSRWLEQWPKAFKEISGWIQEVSYKYQVTGIRIEYAMRLTILIGKGEVR